MYVLCICNEYVMFIYLYSTACLYNKSSEGVNRFCCSWAESHPPKPQHATYCCHGRQQEREACWAMNAACRNQLPPGSPSLQETCWWPPLYLQHLAWHKKSHHLLDRDCLHPYRPEKQRAEGCPSVLHLHLSVDHENLLRQLVIPCTYIVHTLYIHGSYIDILCTCALFIQFLYHRGNFHCELACNPFMIGLDSAYRQESANRYIHIL